MQPNVIPARRDGVLQQRHALVGSIGVAQQLGQAGQELGPLRIALDGAPARRKPLVQVTEARRDPPGQVGLHLEHHHVPGLVDRRHAVDRVAVERLPVEPLAEARGRNDEPAGRQRRNPAPPRRRRQLGEADRVDVASSAESDIAVAREQAGVGRRVVPDPSTGGLPVRVVRGRDPLGVEAVALEVPVQVRPVHGQDLRGLPRHDQQRCRAGGHAGSETDARRER